MMVVTRQKVMEERLHRHVDIVSYRERMNPFLKTRIQQEACYV